MGGKKKKGLFGGVKLPKIKIGKDLGLKAVGKAVGNVAKVATKAVKDTGTAVGKGVGDTVSQVGRTVKDKGTIEAGKNVTRETKKGMEVAAPILTQLAGNALTGGAYGAISSLGNMAQSGKFDLGQAGSAVGSLAGFSPTMMQALQGGTALAKGDFKGAALAGLGSLGSSGGQNFLSSLTGGSGGGSPLISALTNPNALKLATSAISGDKRGLASGLAGYAGFGDTTQNLVGALASGDKKGIAQGLGAAMGLSPELSRALSGAATGNNRDIAMGLLGSTGYMDPKRLQAIDELSGGKFSMDRLQTATQGLLPDMGLGGGSSGADSGGGSDWLKSLQNLGAGFSTGDYVPDAVKGLSTSGMLPFSTSGILPSISNPLSGMGLDLGAGGKGSENTAAIKDYFSNMFGGDNFQAGRVPAGEQLPEEQGFFDQATDAVGNFIGGNQAAIGTGLGALGAGVGYKQYEQNWNVRKDMQAKQRKLLEEAGVDFQKMKYDPARYEEYKQFLSDRIAGGGIGAKEKQMQQEGDIRAGRSAAGQRAAALEQAARTMGGSAGGSGSALAAALAGGQSAMDTQSQTNLAREASAQENLEQSLARKSGLSTQATKEESDLASSQADYRLRQLAQRGAVVDKESLLREELGARQEDLAKGLTGFAQTALNQYESPQAREKRKKMEALASQKAKEEEAYRKAMAQAELDLKRGQRPQTTTPPPAQQTTTTPPQQTAPAPQTTPPPPKKPVPPPAGPSQSQVNQALNRGSYVIKQGDSLSKRYKDLGYNSWQEAYDANKDLIGDNPNLIKTGSSLRRKDELTDKRVSTPAQTMNKKYTGSNIA